MKFEVAGSTLRVPVRPDRKNLLFLGKVFLYPYFLNHCETRHEAKQSRQLLRHYKKYDHGDLAIKQEVRDRFVALMMTVNYHRLFNFITMEKGGAVYILTNQTNTTLYVGVTSDLYSRIIEHREKKYSKSFTARYNLNKLIYYESFHSIEEAIAREKQLKAGSRIKKENLINSMNPEWIDLFDEVSKW